MTETLQARRARLLGPNQPTFYEEPLMAVRGEGVWLWDDAGRRYLDCYNNVPHVGHCNPRVVDAIARQAATLNTHTRYPHVLILDYVERLLGHFDDPLDSALLTCTGSEANDVAMRMAMAATGKRGFVATDFTYHGNTFLVSQLSQSNPSDFGGETLVRFVPAPDALRAADGAAFAASLRDRIAELEDAGPGFAGFIACPHFVNEGFPDLPPGWLTPAVEATREAGGLFIADEVQPGFGRLGSHMWAHQLQGVVPDVVTLGKPMGNGHPVAGVVSRRDVLAGFRERFRYFNTFAGNPVSCAAAMAVLDEIEDRSLMAQAARVGAHALDRLRKIAEGRADVAQVRGRGLIFGMEFVCPGGIDPAPDFTARVVNEMRRRGVILSSLGRGRNALKIRPPMVIEAAEIDLMADTLAEVLDDLGEADG